MPNDKVNLDVGVDTKKALQEIQKLTQTFKGFSSVIKPVTANVNVGKAVSGLGKLGGALDDAEVDSKQVQSSLKSLGNVGDFAGSKMTKFATVMTGLSQAMNIVNQIGAVIGKFKELGRFALDSAANIQALQTSFGVLAESIAVGEKLYSDLVAYANATPFETAHVTQAGQTLLGFGTTTSNLTNQMKILGDVAASLNVPIKALSLIFGQVQAEGKLTGERFKQLNERGVALGQELADKLGIPISALKDEISKGKVSFEVFNEVITESATGTGKFAGGAEKLSKTLGGLISTTKGIGTDLAGNFANVVFHIIDANSAIATFNNYLLEINAYFAQISKVQRLSVQDLGAANKQVELRLKNQKLTLFDLEAEEKQLQSLLSIANLRSIEDEDRLKILEEEKRKLEELSKLPEPLQRTDGFLASPGIEEFEAGAEGVQNKLEEINNEINQINERNNLIVSGTELLGQLKGRITTATNEQAQAEKTTLEQVNQIVTAQQSVLNLINQQNIALGKEVDLDEIRIDAIGIELKALEKSRKLNQDALKAEEKFVKELEKKKKISSEDSKQIESSLKIQKKLKDDIAIQDQNIINFETELQEIHSKRLPQIEKEIELNEKNIAELQKLLSVETPPGLTKEAKRAFEKHQKELTKAYQKALTDRYNLELKHSDEVNKIRERDLERENDGLEKNLKLRQKSLDISKEENRDKDKTKKEVEPLEKSREQVFEAIGAIAGSIGDTFVTSIVDSLSGDQDIEESLSDKVKSGLADTIEKGNFGATIGSSLGLAIGGPIGAAVGGGLGKAVDLFSVKLLKGSEEAAKKLKEEIEKETIQIQAIVKTSFEEAGSQREAFQDLASQFPELTRTELESFKEAMKEVETQTQKTLEEIGTQAVDAIQAIKKDREDFLSLGPQGQAIRFGSNTSIVETSDRGAQQAIGLVGDRSGELATQQSNIEFLELQKLNQQIELLRQERLIEFQEQIATTRDQYDLQKVSDKQIVDSLTAIKNFENTINDNIASLESEREIELSEATLKSFGDLSKEEIDAINSKYDDGIKKLRDDEKKYRETEFKLLGNIDDNTEKTANKPDNTSRSESFFSNEFAQLGVGLATTLSTLALGGGPNDPNAVTDAVTNTLASAAGLAANAVLPGIGPLVSGIAGPLLSKAAEGLGIRKSQEEILRELQLAREQRCEDMLAARQFATDLVVNTIKEQDRRQTPIQVNVDNRMEVDGREIARSNSNQIANGHIPGQGI